MEIKNIVLHEVIKTENSEPKVNPSYHLLDTSNETVIDFVKKLMKSFKSKKPTYGTFQEDQEVYPFQKKVQKYRENNDFLSFTENSVKILRKEIQVPNATGGYVVFAHYIEKQIDYLFTIMLDKSAQFVISDDLDLSKLQTLDVDKLARANRLNITKWEEKSELYLAFIKGTREVSSYFQKFIGNTDLTSSKKNADNLKKALNKYMRENSYTEEKKEAVNRQIQQYVETQFKKDEDVNIESISAFVKPEEPSDFLNYIQDDESLEVSGNFRVSRKSDFSFLHKAVLKGKGYKLEFEKVLINQKVIQRIGSDVIIKDVPEEILNAEFGTN